MKIDANSPKFIDINNMSKSTYQDTMNRFNSILSSKLRIQQNNYVKNTIDTDKPVFNIAGKVGQVGKSADKIIADVTTGSAGAGATIDRFFSGTNLAGLGKSFESAGKKHGVNPFFLASVAVVESGFGESEIARDKKNLFGYKAYDRDPYGSAKSFTSFQAGIEQVAEAISRDYLSPNGSYYNGKSTKDINKRYASDDMWHQKVNDIIKIMVEY